MNEMWHDEQDVRNALQRVVDTPAPAVRTDLSEVIRRGKRRVLVTRISAVAASVAAVGVIGLGAAAISGNLFNGGDPTALPPAASTGPQTSGPKATLDLPGWTQLENPARTTTPAPPASTGTTFKPSVEICSFPSPPLPSGRSILPEGRYLPAFTQAVSRAVGVDQVPVSHKNYVNENRGHLAVTVKGKQLPGTVRLEAGRFGGSAEGAADFYRYSSGCKEPLRRSLPDGAIMQLFPEEDYGGKSPTRRAGVYTPNGRFYNITVTLGVVSENGDGGMARQGGFDDLALTQAQLAQVAEAMAQLG